MTLTDSLHNDTLARLEASSRDALSYAMGLTAGLGGVLAVLNAVLLACLCRAKRREEEGKRRSNTGTRWRS